MTTILAIGATGTVGRHLVPQLVRRGLSVRALVRNPAAELPAGVDRVVGDLADPGLLAPRSTASTPSTWPVATTRPRPTGRTG